MAAQANQHQKINTKYKIAAVVSHLYGLVAEDTIKTIRSGSSIATLASQTSQLQIDRAAQVRPCNLPEAIKLTSSFPLYRENTVSVPPSDV